MESRRGEGIPLQASPAGISPAAEVPVALASSTRGVPHQGVPASDGTALPSESEQDTGELLSSAGFDGTTSPLGYLGPSSRSSLHPILHPYVALCNPLFPPKSENMVNSAGLSFP